MVVEPDAEITIREVAEPAIRTAYDPAAAAEAEAQTIAEMVEALYPPPSTLVPSTPLPLVRAIVTGESDADIVARAAAPLVERVHLSRAIAMRLMEQEATDTAQSIADVARAMLGEDSGDATRGDVVDAA